ncbi:hypothetical protein BJF83_02565 [Nocardiopsis sp. CNR-923]|uniref:DUF4870 domain-containing protein n=1 Tax=Nocardiopsis sp. CNR-923 TaxID=1904965 RepID=UPI0009620B5A|nr:DUF4870 domain-containing protein [Nocardiopsis sp. CNR-923]OLT27444.1 hypothetical protein BJF83_02565 [Nocardiopsis sp. CNR-923]
MSHPNTPPPEEPDDRERRQQGQEETGGQAQGGYGGYQPGGPTPGSAEPSSATSGQPNQAERQMGLIAHLGGGLVGFFFSGFGWLVPLIVYLIKKDESPFVRDQAAHALNFQLLITIGIVVSWVLTLVIIGVLTWIVVAVVCLVFGILGGLAANRGEWYRYPFNVTWVK